jgi:putative ABC transport system permease protein
MRTLREFLQRLLGSVRSTRTDADLQDELRAHLELAAEREAQRGHPPAERVRRARVRVGGVAQAMDSLRDQRGLPWLDALRADVVFGWRQITRHRVASLAAVLSLGLAMGAALAAFRLVDAVLLRPLPVSDPSRLFVITKSFLDADRRRDLRDDFDYPTYRRYVTRTDRAADLMLLGMAVRRRVVIGSGEAETAVQQFVSGNAFATLGLQPAMGRLLGAGDDVVPDGHPVAVITHEYWQRRFGGDAEIIGRTFRMAGRVYTIVGVTSRGFSGTEPGAITDVFVPSMMNAEALNMHGWTWFRIWLRPKANVDPADAQAVLQAGFRADQAERAKDIEPDTPKARIDAFWSEQLAFLPAGSGASRLQKVFRQPLWILAALGALLVLVACANVANLLLARAMSRKVEMALRLSIGAARGRLIQLLLVESALLAILAATAGGLFASWAAPFIVTMLAPAERPVRLVLDLDWRTLITGATLTIAVTMLFGLTPALRASSAPLLDTLKEVRGQRAHRRLADALVAVQAAFCVFLLFGASLFVGTLQRLQDRPLGFTPDNLLHVSVESPRTHPREAWAQLAASIRGLPQVESVAVAGWAPLTGNRWRYAVTIPGRPPQENSPNWVSVLPGYLGTMRIPLVAGRDFRIGDRGPGQDDAGRPIPGVAIVNETFARVYFDGRNPVGRFVTVKSLNAPMEIVGMTADAVYFSVREASHPAVFVPFEPERSGATVLVRTQGAALDLPRVLTREIPRLVPDMQVHEMAPFSSIVTQQMIRERLLAALSTFFAAVALVLAVVGMYGVLNYAVTREQREIGLRMALGARPGHVVTLVTTRLARMVVLGAVAGLGVGLGLGQFVRTLLFEMQASDPAALAPPIIALAAAALLAVLPPAIRAVRTDPARTIRTEG